MSYKKLDIWERAREVSIAIHKMTLTELPKFEMYEEGREARYEGLQNQSGRISWRDMEEVDMRWNISAS